MATTPGATTREASDSGPDLKHCFNCGADAVVVTPADAGFAQQAYCAQHTPISYRHLLKDA